MMMMMMLSSAHLHANVLHPSTVHIPFDIMNKIPYYIFSSLKILPVLPITIPVSQCLLMEACNVHYTFYSIYVYI